MRRIATPASRLKRLLDRRTLPHPSSHRSVPIVAQLCESCPARQWPPSETISQKSPEDPPKFSRKTLAHLQGFPPPHSYIYVVSAHPTEAVCLYESAFPSTIHHSC